MNTRHNKTPKITLLKGIELGLQVHLPSKINTLLNNNFFDYVIGSIHIVDEMDPYCHEYWETFSSEEKGILKYFETGLSCLEKINTFGIEKLKTVVQSSQNEEAENELSDNTTEDNTVENSNADSNQEDVETSTEDPSEVNADSTDNAE